MEKKTVRHYVGKTKTQGIPSPGVPRLTAINPDQVVNRSRLLLQNEVNPLSRGIRAIQACNPSPRNATPILQRSLGSQQTSLNTSDLDQLSERIRREKLKQQVQVKDQLIEKTIYRTPMKTPVITQKLQTATRPQFQQRQSTPRLQAPGLVTPVRPGQNRMPTPRQGSINSGRVEQRRVVVNSPMRQKTTGAAQRQSMPMQSLQNEQNVQVIQTESPEVQEKNSGRVTQQGCTPKLETESNSSESYAYLQRVIENPSTAIVQSQIKGNVAKMLVVLLDGEQRLITFDIPAEDCTVQDLLEQVRVCLLFVLFHYFLVYSV